MEFLSEPKIWVTLAFFMFIGLSYRKIGNITIKVLDNRSARIQAELQQAQKLRAEAEQLLAVYKQKQSEYLQEANLMLQKARKDADTMVQTAQADLKTSLDARMQQAIEKISQEESKAINDVRSHVVDIALAAARAVIIDQVGNLSQQDLIKLALTDMERKFH